MVFQRAFPILVAALIAVPAGAGTGTAPPATQRWVGRPAPVFALPGIDGKVVDAGKQFGRRPVVLVFYRGNW